MALLKRWFDLLRWEANTKDFVSVKRGLMVADLVPGMIVPDTTGYTYTLASALGDLLADAEEKYGARDPCYCFLGIEFGATGPKVWFPGHRKNVVIQLGLNSLTSNQCALFELAHECIHLISPCAKSEMSVLEEGLASAFSIDTMEHHHGKGWWSNCNNHADYFAAAVHVRSLLTLDGEIIKKLRQEEPHISSITVEMILRHCPLAGEALAQTLSAKFVSHKKT